MKRHRRLSSDEENEALEKRGPDERKMHSKGEWKT